MIRIVLALAVVVALVLVVYDRDTDQPAQAHDQRIETGWAEFDSLLADNLSPGTHSAISGTLGGSADTLRGWGQGVVTQVKDVAEIK